MRRQGRKGCIKLSSPFLSFPIFLAGLWCLHCSLLDYSVHLSFFIVSSFFLSVFLTSNEASLDSTLFALAVHVFFIASKAGITAFFSSNICWFLQLSGLFLAWLNDLNLSSSTEGSPPESSLSEQATGSPASSFSPEPRCYLFSK